MATEYRVMYKCRLCGEVYKGCGTSNTKLVFANLCSAVIGSDKVGFYKNDIHYCNDKDMGIADIQGVKAYEV